MLGERVFINSYASINCMELIKIGPDCIFGEGVRLYDHNHGSDGERLFREQEFTTGKIVVHKNCWIGSNVIVLKGVTIGANSVVGAGCVLHKDVPPNSVIVNGSKPKNLTVKVENE